MFDIDIHILSNELWFGLQLCLLSLFSVIVLYVLLIMEYEVN